MSDPMTKRWRATMLSASLLASAGCGAHSPSAVTLTSASNAPRPPAGHMFVHDDFARARALSAEMNLPLVVEPWAPWCNSCLLMKAAMRSAAVTAYDDRFVWLDVNLDVPANDAFIHQNSVQEIPVLYVFDPRGSLTATWFGTGTGRELGDFLASASRAPTSRGADERVVLGDEKMRAGDGAAAAAAYRDALQLAGEAWPRRPSVEERLSTALQISDPTACVTMAAGAAPSMGRTRSFVTVVLAGLVCSQDPAARPASASLERLERLADEALALDVAEEDDRYGLYSSLVATRAGAGDTAGAHRYAEQYLRYVESLPLSADADLRGARDHARLGAATALGDPARVVPALEATERALPGSYAASLRLATAYLKARRFEEAVAAGTRGLAKNPGPQDATVLLLQRARAKAALGDVGAARADLVLARDRAEKITPPSRKYMPQLSGSITKELGGLPTSKT